MVFFQESLVGKQTNRKKIPFINRRETASRLCMVNNVIMNLESQKHLSFFRGVILNKTHNDEKFQQERGRGIYIEKERERDRERETDRQRDRDREI